MTLHVIKATCIPHNLLRDNSSAVICDENVLLPDAENVVVFNYKNCRKLSGTDEPIAVAEAFTKYFSSTESSVSW